MENKKDFEAKFTFKNETEKENRIEFETNFAFKNIIELDKKFIDRVE